MTLDEVKKLPKLSKKRLEEINNFNNTDFQNHTEQSRYKVSQMIPAYKLHPEWYKNKNIG